MMRAGDWLCLLAGSLPASSPSKPGSSPSKAGSSPSKACSSPFALAGFARGFSPRQHSLGGAAAADQSQKWPEEYFLYLQLKDINCRLKLV